MPRTPAPSTVPARGSDAPGAGLDAVLERLADHEADFVKAHLLRKGKLLDGSAWLSGTSARPAGITWGAFLDAILVDPSAMPVSASAQTRVRGILAGFAAVAELPVPFATFAADALRDGVGRLRVARELDLPAVLGEDVASRVLAVCERCERLGGYQRFLHNPLR